MVRNIASTPETSQTVDRSMDQQPAYQLLGADEHTKTSTNRVAIDQAADAERLQFDARVKGTQALPSNTSMPPAPLPTAIRADLPKPDNRTLQDWQMQLMVLEQHNKQRLAQAKQDRDEAEQHRASGTGTVPRVHAPSDRDPGNGQASGIPGAQTLHSLPGAAAAYAPSVTYPRTDPGGVALQDYQMQLMLLKQQNKKRLEMARMGNDEVKAMAEQDTTAAHAARNMRYFGRVNEDREFVEGELGASAEWPTVTKPKKKKGWKAQQKAVKMQEELERRERERGSGIWDLNHTVHPPTLPEIDLLSDSARLTAPFGQPQVFGFPWNASAPTEDLSNQSPDDNLLRKAKHGKDKKSRKAAMNVDDTPQQPIMATREAASVYCKPFCDFMTNNPTVFHAVDSQRKQLIEMGWTELDERDKWDIVPGGKYFTERNGSSMIAFSVGETYKAGNGCAIIAGHVDALTAKLKPISEVPNKAGYLQLGVAPYAGGLNSTWWDRDLGIGGRVLVKEDDKIVTKLVKLDWPIARIPTLAPHFGAAAAGPFNPETQMVPIIGLEGTESSFRDPFGVEKPFEQPPILGHGDGPVGSFVNTQPPRLVKHIGDAIGLTAATYGNIVGWELELFDVQPATVGGLDKEFIFAGRIDDKLCSWAAMQALISGQTSSDAKDSSIIKMVGLFDNEEIGSQLRQGAKSNFLPLTIERVVGCLGKSKKGANLVGRTYANSFLVSSDVTHAVNPNFLNAYLENHAPHLNVGLSIHADPNGHMTTDAVSTAILQSCADSVGAKLQVFQIRNDSRSGGTVGPMLSSMTGIRSIDAGLPQLSMHSIRATIGSLDPGLGVITYMAFLNRFEHVDKQFRK